MIVWVHTFRPRSAWYLLGGDERRRLLDEWAGSAERASSSGARRVGRFSVRGQSDYERLEVWLFPTSDALEAYWADLTDHKYADWFETSNLVGVETP
jgi:hypothetical protein